jgi:hypothetical protein
VALPAHPVRGGSGAPGRGHPRGLLVEHLRRTLAAVATDRMAWWAAWIAMPIYQSVLRRQLPLAVRVNIGRLIY